MDDDRRIGRKQIIMFLKPIIGCGSWGAVRNQVKKNGLPLGRAPNGKPCIVPDDVRGWVEERKKRAAAQAAGARYN